MPTEYDPAKGMFARGPVISLNDFNRIKDQYLANGWTRYRVPGLTGPNAEFIAIYNNPATGAPTDLPSGSAWTGFIREEAGKHYVIAYEVNPYATDLLFEMTNPAEPAQEDLAKQAIEADVRSRQAENDKDINRDPRLG